MRKTAGAGVRCYRTRSTRRGSLPRPEMKSRFGQVTQILDTLAHHQISSIAIKEGIEFDTICASMSQYGTMFLSLNAGYRPGHAESLP